MRDEKGRFIKGSIGNLGKKLPRQSKEHRRKISEANRGKVMSQEFRRKLSISRMGIKNPMFGRKQTTMARKKISEAFAGKNHPNWKGGWKNKLPKCVDCKKQLANPKALRCRKCFPKAMSGANCYLWKGGITPIGKIQRTKFQQTIQKAVFERDNYTCQLCGERGGQLQVDHIQSWAKYVELRFNMDNCRTLCMACHYMITFGKPMPKEIKTWGHNLKKIIEFEHKLHGGAWK